MMKQYALYLESGPRRRTTMVHVPDLLGCIAQGPTTEAALEATPEAIRSYLRFLQRHDAAVNPSAAFSTKVVEHVMEGAWLGYGDPTPGFSYDFQALSTEDLEIYLCRLTWLQDDLLRFFHELPEDQWALEPAGGGRSLFRILEHLAESHAVYLRYQVGKVDGLSEALRAAQRGLPDLPSALEQLWQISNARLKAMTVIERQAQVPHGQVTWTARRALRRMLEHAWEHYREISSRLEARS